MENDQKPNTKCQGIPKEQIRKELSGVIEEVPKLAEVKGAESEKRSADEEMAAYEESLKEDDWGHQPC